VIVSKFLKYTKLDRTVYSSRASIRSASFTLRIVGWEKRQRSISQSTLSRRRPDFNLSARRDRDFTLKGRANRFQARTITSSKTVSRFIASYRARR